MQHHGKIYDNDKVPILPLHPHCRCTYLPVLEEPAASAEFIYKDELVYYDARNDYHIELPEYSSAANKGLSKAAEDVARRGSEDRLEHMYLVDLNTGNLAHYESGTEATVGYEYRRFLEENSNHSFAIVHNHNIISSFSESDLLSPLANKGIPIQIAVQNDGMKYIAVLKKEKPNGFYPDFYYEKELEELNNASRNGKITPIERMFKREEIIVNGLIRDFYGGEVIELDGRKK